MNLKKRVAKMKTFLFVFFVNILTIFFGDEVFANTEEPAREFRFDGSSLTGRYYGVRGLDIRVEDDKDVVPFVKFRSHFRDRVAEDLEIFQNPSGER